MNEETITVEAPVHGGDMCKHRDKTGLGICRFYRTQACMLFNRTIHGDRKDQQCLDACKASRPSIPWQEARPRVIA